MSKQQNEVVEVEKEETPKYYWIKLRNTFLTSEKVDFLMSQNEGANYVVLYQCLCLNTINTGGKLITELGTISIPYDVSKIKRSCKWFSEDTIRIALSLYKNLGLVYEDTDGYLQIDEFGKMVGSETKWAEYKRGQRGKEKQQLLLKTSLDNVQDNVQQEYRDKSIENKENKNKEKREEKDTDFACVREKDVIDVKPLNVYEERFEKFWKHYPRKVGKQAVVNWFKKNKPSQKLLETMLEAIKEQSQSEQWLRKIIPNPMTWLNQGRWEDTVEVELYEDDPLARFEIVDDE